MKPKYYWDWNIIVRGKVHLQTFILNKLTIVYEKKKRK